MLMFSLCFDCSQKYRTIGKQVREGKHAKSQVSGSLNQCSRAVDLKPHHIIILENDSSTTLRKESLPNAFMVIGAKWEYFLINMSHGEVRIQFMH